MTYAGLGGRSPSPTRPPAVASGRRLADTSDIKHSAPTTASTTITNERSPDVNSVTALMLSRAIEQDRRREIERRRPHRPMTAERVARPSTGRRSWSLRLPRFGLAGSKA